MDLEYSKMFIFVLLGYFALVSGYVQESSVCKDLKLVKNFNPARFGHGNWYQIARYDNDHENVRKCLTYNFKTDIAKNNMIFKSPNTSDDSPNFFEGVGKFTNDDIKANKITYEIKYGWPRKEIVLPVFFVDTDYDNYAIAYSCPYDEKKKSYIEYAWLLSRSKNMSKTAMAAVEEYMNDSKALDSNKFIWLDFSDESCIE